MCTVIDIHSSRAINDPINDYKDTAEMPSSSSAIPSMTTPSAPPAATSSPASGNGGGGGGPTSSPLLFFVALGFGVVFTNLWYALPGNSSFHNYVLSLAKPIV